MNEDKSCVAEKVHCVGISEFRDIAFCSRLRYNPAKDLCTGEAELGQTTFWLTLCYIKQSAKRPEFIDHIQPHKHNLIVIPFSSSVIIVPHREQITLFAEPHNQRWLLFDLPICLGFEQLWKHEHQNKSGREHKEVPSHMYGPRNLPSHTPAW